MSKDIIEDGFGSSSPAVCPICGCRAMYVCRPGDIRCGVCYDGNPKEDYGESRSVQKRKSIQKGKPMPTFDKELEAIREAMAKNCYQYAYLIDDKNIEKRWKLLRNKERWLDCADQILSLQVGNLKVGVYEVESEPTKVDMDIYTWRDYSPDMAYEQAQKGMRKANYRKIREG